jgi:hypothetical protein
MNIRYVAVLMLTFVLGIHLLAGGKYIASTGSNSNSGTLNSPYLTIDTALTHTVIGDTIYVRGGVYTMNTPIVLAVSGTDTLHRRYLFAYQNEHPVFDYSSSGIIGVTGYTDGLDIYASYWHIKGISIKGAMRNGIRITNGHYNIIECCHTYENRNTGFQLTTYASHNRIINCDSFYNRDTSSSDSYDGNADGFSPKLNVGTGNYFYGCRSWQNSDDGWDGYLRGADSVTTAIENCWSFSNGYLKNGTIGTGNGNGFKMGGGDKTTVSGITYSNGDSLRHYMTLKNCLAFNNKSKGFDQNNNRASMTLINCTGYNNDGYNFGMGGYVRANEVMTIKNCISYPDSSVNIDTMDNVHVLVTNSWMLPFAEPASTDFISLDTTGLRAERKEDGSLPDIQFMHLAAGSQFIDAGTDAGLPYNGSAADLGCFEYTTITSVKDPLSHIASFSLSQNYPNPFNPSTIIRYSLPVNGSVSLKVYDVIGREVAILVNETKVAGSYQAVFNASRLGSGVYFYKLQVGNNSMCKKMLLIK